VALYGHRAAPTPREGSEGAEFVFMCVGNDNDVRDVVYGSDGALAGAEAGAVLVDHTTASSEVARRSSPRHAPSSGSASSTRRCRVVRAGAENGQLTVMCGADDEAFYASPNR
jgi:3-hydroxyisobutyrate dehydrogenase-like beta-hydroxyacid dehydrogenase